MRASVMLASAASHQLFRPLPAPREVHLWCLFPEDVLDPKLLNSYHKLLSSEELAKVLEGSCVKTQHERLLARALVRTTLARYGMVDPSSLRFSTNEFGKPKVVWPAQVEDKSCGPHSLFFNLSHTQSLVACAVTVNSEVGIDVEERDRKLRRNLIALARRRFSPEEADWLSQIDCPIEQQQRFMQLWTLKREFPQEAYVKALGTGIRETPLKEFSFALKPSATAQSCLERAVDFPAHSQAESITMEFSSLMASKDKPRIPANRWQFLLLQPSPLHIAAVCTQSHQSQSPEDEHLEGGSEKCFKLKMWRTVPLVGDWDLREGAIALGMTSPGHGRGDIDSAQRLKYSSFADSVRRAINTSTDLVHFESLLSRSTTKLKALRLALATLVGFLFRCLLLRAVSPTMLVAHSICRTCVKSVSSHIFNVVGCWWSCSSRPLHIYSKFDHSRLDYQLLH